MDAAEVQRVVGKAREESQILTAELAEARRQIAHLETALETNRAIGIAIGILMARRGLTVDEAFETLRAISQRTHRRIRELAEEIVYTGELAGDIAS